ncbi:MAG: hypothetical protein CVU05_15615 [Bacteroidetes bacterium HGW-Bacteroidetes-21]|jgi:hypothetical protein|nr:MAG: hypothetical protein CVU05_15615 [Bacteroidetes bacterium HGW-Bacteroidetes-21]
MSVTMTSDELLNCVNCLNYKKNGIGIENDFCEKITDDFPNSELFWKLFVTPMSNRIGSNINNDEPGARTEVDSDIKELSHIHFSVFYNLVQALKCLDKKDFEYFEYFYIRMGMVSSLSIALLYRVFLLVKDCNKGKEFVQDIKLKKNVQGELSDWYNKEKKKISKNTSHRSRTFHISIYKESVYNNIKDYINDSNLYSKMSEVFEGFAKFRNPIIHDAITMGLYIDGEVYLPLKEKRKLYKKHDDFLNVDMAQNGKDFIVQKKLMESDFILIKSTLNDLWKKPIDDLYRLLYVEKNPVLLKKFQLTLI